MSAFSHGQAVVTESTSSNEPHLLMPSGRLDAFAAPRLRQQITDLLDQGQSCLIVDLSAVTYLSSSALRVLLAGHKRARQMGGDLVLCCTQPQVLRVIKVVGFDQVFALHESEDQARAAFLRQAQATSAGRGKR